MKSSDPVNLGPLPAATLAAQGQPNETRAAEGDLLPGGSARRESIFGDAFWLFFWFGVCTILIKAHLSLIPLTFRPGKFWPEFGELGSWRNWGHALAFMFRQDILFALAAGLIAQLLLHLLRPWPFWRGAVWWFCFVFCAVGVFFTIADIPIYLFTFAPLNWTLLDILGPHGAWRIIRLFLTRNWATGIIAWTAAYPLLVWLSIRFWRRKQSRVFIVAQVTLAAAIIYYTWFVRDAMLYVMVGVAALFVLFSWAASRRIIPDRRIMLLVGQTLCAIGIFVLLGKYRAYEVVALVFVPLLYIALLWLLSGRVQIVPAIVALAFAGGCMAMILLKAGRVSAYLAGAMGTSALVYLLASWISGRFRATGGLSARAPREAALADKLPVAQANPQISDFRFQISDYKFQIYGLLQLICLIALVGYLIDVHIQLDVKNMGWRQPRDDRRITDSAYYQFLRSCALELVRDPAVRCHGRFEPDDLKDFETFDEAKVVTFPTPNIARRPKNVIFFVLESVGTRYMSLFNNRFATTPRLQAAAAEALVFSNVYAPVSNSGQSLISMTLSMYAPMTWREYTRDNPHMPGTALSNALKDRGYRTAFITSLDWTYADGDKFLQTRGFDHIWDYNDLNGEKIGFWGVDDSKLIDKSLQWIKGDRSKPFFLMCWNQGTHDPYQWSDTCYSVYVDYLKEHLNNNHGLFYGMWWHIIMYLNALHHIDDQLGRLFQGLKDAGLADDTLVVIVGDHGECFEEPHENWGHAGDLYQESINIPCIFWNPAMFKSRPRSEIVGHMNDVPATILDILNIRAPGAWQGRSLLSPQRSPRVYFYGPRDYYMLGLRERTAEHDYKYICNTLEPSRGDELYDLAVDPEEHVNIAAKNPLVVHRYRQRLAAWMWYEVEHYQRLLHPGR